MTVLDGRRVIEHLATRLALRDSAPPTGGDSTPRGRRAPRAKKMHRFFFERETNERARYALRRQLYKPRCTNTHAMGTIGYAPYVIGGRCRFCMGYEPYGYDDFIATANSYLRRAGDNEARVPATVARRSS